MFESSGTTIVSVLPMRRTFFAIVALRVTGLFRAKLAISLITSRHSIFIMRQPLSSIRVLDLSRVRSGPTAVRQLADWGADVIKIESTAGPEAELFGDTRGSSDFQNLQRNKRSCTLNLKSAEGVAIFKHMAETADVVVENFRPDVKARLGIDYPALRAVNPRIIYASISGFGEDGPYRTRAGFDQVVQGMGGLMSITGLPGQGPVRVGIPLADLSAGLLAAQGIILALYDREYTGAGQWVTTSLLQAQVFLLDFQATRWLDDHEVPQQAGNNHPTNIPDRCFQNLGRLYQRGRQRPNHVGAFMSGHRRRRAFVRSTLLYTEAAFRKSRRAQSDDRAAARDGDVRALVRLPQQCRCAERSY